MLSAIQITNNHVSQKQTKHIEIDYHLVNHQYLAQTISLLVHGRYHAPTCSLLTKFSILSNASS